MVKGYLLIIVLVIFVIICSLYNESFSQNYISQVYTPSILERNTLLCYISKSEYYHDIEIIKNKTMANFDNIPMKITVKEEDKYTADIAILPECYITQRLKEYNETPYDYLSHLKDLSWSVIQLKNINNANNLSELSGKELYLKKGGYVEELWNELYKLFNYESDLKITLYNDDNDAINALQNGLCDGIITLMMHPNSYIIKLSYLYKLHIVPFNINDEILPLFVNNIRGFKKTKITLKQYRYSDLQTEIQTFGCSLSIFVSKTLSNEIVEKITEYIMNPQGIIRSSAISGSRYIPFHPGTKKWLEDKGFLSITSNTEHPGCSLLVGKEKCQGEAKRFAIKTYNDNMWGSKDSTEQTVLPFLRNAYNNIDDEELGTFYETVINSSFVCFEDMKIRDAFECTKNNYTWDRPCLIDDDCPFYKANKNYPNNFGKCKINGFCEMPVGIIPKGYRKYDKKYKPICHNCPASNPTCCEKTEIMPSADYMYADDYDERLLNKDELNSRGIE
tara:strand:+ start:1469 stop:2983 length:1515 start_codon:yes stop_codon:yes gene_type:complete